MAQQTFRVTLSDGRSFDVTTADGQPPTEDEVMSQLGASEPAPISGQPETPTGSATGRFGANLWEMVNPVAAVKGVYHAVTNPIDTGTAILSQQGNQFSKARQAFREGRYSEALGHGAASALPIVGPLAAESGEQIGRGDVAGGLGKATGLLVPFGMAEAVSRMGVRAIPRGAADALESGAASRYADVMSPKSSAAKGQRMAAKAEKIAPDIAKGGNAAWTREGLLDNLETKLAEAGTKLDKAADARNAGAPIETQPIIDALMQERAKLTAKPFEASKPTRQTTVRESAILDESGRPIRTETKRAQPVGDEVVPGPSQKRVGEIDRAIEEIQALGEIAPYEGLRTIRASYDKPAAVKYNPAVTPDFLATQGIAEGAADVTRVIRDTLAKADPVTTAANADYALYRSARDITKASVELERAKPKVGRQIIARLTGAIVGGQQGGTVGAIAGYAGAPLIEQFLSAGFTTKLKSAQLMQDMADAIRSGNTTRAASISFKLRQLAKQAEATTTRATAGQELQPQER